MMPRLGAKYNITIETISKPKAEYQTDAWFEQDLPVAPAVMVENEIVVEGAEMIGLKQLERLLAVVDQARGKVVLLGESGQLEAMGSLSPLRSMLDKVGLPAPASAGLDIRG